MENWFELLIPVFVVLTWVLQFLFKKKEDNSDEPKRSPTAEEAESAERARRLQEEIRRRIAERRGQAPPAQADESTETQPAPAPASAPSSRRNYDQHQHQRRNLAEDHRSERTTSSFGGDSLEDRLARQMEVVRKSEEERKAAEERARQREIAARKQFEQAAGEQARKSHPAAAVAAIESDPQAYASFLEGLKQDLNNPLGARQAFIFHEIFGAPVGARGRQSGPISDLF